MSPSDQSGEPSIPTRHLCLPAGGDLAEGVRGQWSGILEHAGQCAVHAPEDPVSAVHEFRKAIRRARAMLRILERILPRKVYRQTRVALRDIHRATSDLRDRDVVLGTLESLGLSTDVIATASRRIDAAEPASAERSCALLNEQAQRLPELIQSVVQALPDRIRMGQLRKAMARSYRRTRASMRALRRTGEDEALHDWRKRTKELRYQVELFIDNASSKKALKLTARLAEVTTILGEIVDLMVLGEYAHQHLSAENRALVKATSRDERSRRERLALRAGRKLFKPSPDEFARGLVEMYRR